MEPDFYTVEEVAEKLRLQVYTIRNYIRRGQLLAYKVGRDYRIKRVDFEKFLENRRSDKKDD